MTVDQHQLPECHTTDVQSQRRPSVRLIKHPISAATPTQSSNVIFQAREMFRSVLFTILWGSAVAVIDSGLDRHWVLWKKIHSKVYSHEVQEPGSTYFRMFLTLTQPFHLGTCQVSSEFCVMWSTVTLYFRWRSWLAG